MIRALAALVLLGTTTTAAHAGSRVFALVVTNNRSADLGRPDLQYADDDGAKYHEVFRMVAAAEDTILLTELDRDTQKLFPTLGAIKPPTKGELALAAERIERGAKEALRAGQTVDFYFVFAGHGDVDQGRGFLELSDGAFTSDELEALLTRIPTTRTHVILDSCNSFFVLNARKPGGRRFATAEDAIRGLSARLPRVGVFLSTSAEAEVFEWSELQSGIFSHAVRSGLAGAADVDGDGHVSYEELRAFMDVAVAEIKNPAYRPRVFARGPGGQDSAPLFDLSRATGPSSVVVAIDADAAQRLTIRDAEELTWLDVHKEQGASIHLRLPARLAGGATIEERGAQGRVVKRYRLDASSEVRLASLAAQEPTLDTRGPGDVFRMLFARPFGPKALAEQRALGNDDSKYVFGVRGKTPSG